MRADGTLPKPEIASSLDAAALAGGVYAEVDGVGAVRECDETNNGASAGGLACGKN